MSHSYRKWEPHLLLTRCAYRLDTGGQLDERHGVEGEIATSIIALIVWLVIMDFGMKCLKYAIVAK